MKPSKRNQQNAQAKAAKRAGGKPKLTKYEAKMRGINPALTAPYEAGLGVESDPYAYRDAPYDWRNAAAVMLKGTQNG